jgi:oligoendopeptidase F
MNTIETVGGDVYRKYMIVKSKILNLPKLSCADVNAPLPLKSEKTYSWDSTKELILEAFRKFDPSFAEYAEDMFKRNHIDAAVRNGKRNGAYCDTWYNGKTSFILLSFTGKLKELYTLAHELGHAIHGYLATRENSYFNFHATSAIAECASIFGELLMTDLLLEKAQSKQEKMKILAHVLDEAGQAAFQVSARVWFETSLYDAIERGENLDGPTISKYWCAGRDKIYGDTVEWFKEMDYEWAMKPHYFFPNYRYYNYPYIFAQLFVYTLYQTYKSEGPEFIPKFKKLLSLGGSISPEDLAKIVGLDLTKPDFWKLGIKQYGDFVDQLESLIN